ALDAHQRGDLTLPGDAADVGGCAGHLEAFGVAAHLLAHGVDHVEGAPGRAAAFGGLLADEFFADVDGEELGVEAAFFHAPDVCVRPQRAVSVDPATAEVEVFVHHGRGDVVVRIDDDGLA